MPDPEPITPPVETPPIETPPEPEMVPKTELVKTIGERQQAKERSRALQTQMDTLVEANGGKPLTKEDIEAFRTAQDTVAANEVEAAKKRGDFDSLIETERTQHRTALEERDTKFDALRSAYAEEKLGVAATTMLAELEVVKEAVKTARKALVDGDAVQGVRMEFVQDPDSKKWNDRLIDSAGNTAIDPDTGKDLTKKVYAARFKENHPFFFKREVKSGSGNNTDSGVTAGGQVDLKARLEAAMANKDQAEYQKIRAELMGTESSA